MTREDLAAKAIAILQTMVERHKASDGDWIKALWPISYRSLYRENTPDAESPEVILLISSGFLYLIHWNTHPDIQDQSLQLRVVDIPRSEDAIRKYLAHVGTADLLQLL